MRVRDLVPSVSAEVLTRVFQTKLPINLVDRTSRFKKAYKEELIIIHGVFKDFEPELSAGNTEVVKQWEEYLNQESPLAPLPREILDHIGDINTDDYTVLEPLFASPPAAEVHELKTL